MHPLPQIIHILFSHGLFSLGHSYYLKAWHRLNKSVEIFLFYFVFFNTFADMLITMYKAMFFTGHCSKLMVFDL